MYIANCPFNKMKILSEATRGLEKSFPMMYSNIGLSFCETLPLMSTATTVYNTHDSLRIFSLRYLADLLKVLSNDS